MKKLVLTFCAFALSVASAAENTYRFTLQETASLNGTALKPGDYKLQVEGDKAVLKSGKTLVEVPVKLESSERKFAATTVDLDSAGNGKKISEIHVGGTRTRIVFSGGAAAGQE